MIKLQIFVSDDCWACKETHRIAAETRARFTDVDVSVLDLLSDQRPAAVFAAPTYLLNGKIISLGNPRREELWAQFSQKRTGFENSGGMD